MKLKCAPIFYGIMAYWEEVAEATSYNVILFINDQVLSRKSLDRNEFYYTFTGLAAIDNTTRGLISSAASRIAKPIAGGGGYYSPTPSGKNYYVQVEAESRYGKVLSTSEKIMCTVNEL
jgi:hypothetical protein